MCSGAPEEVKQNGTQAYSVRNYSIVGNYKIGFPQWRTMRCQYPEAGPCLLEVSVSLHQVGSVRSMSSAVGWGGGVLSRPLPEEGLSGSGTWWRHCPYSTPLHRAEGMEPGT